MLYLRILLGKNKDPGKGTLLMGLDMLNYYLLSGGA